MGLGDSPVTATIAVSDMARATEFYEGKLGLSDAVEQGDGGRTYTVGSGTRIHVYPSPDNAGKSEATLASFTVDDVESAVDELSGKGVTFEQYGEPINTDDTGIARLGDLVGAWFKDPDGNTLAVSNV
jgi:catechol 2,3-dioxygenase-like lactoylglutathione lyase family enzyme